MRIETADGDVIELGTTETNPTVSIVNYSKRSTDDFGVTTVVERGFARTMSVRLGLPFDEVDALQRRLADLRATSAMWIADERFGSLAFEGYYKEFELDLAVPPLSYCTLTVEGLTETAPLTDTGGDPAPVGSPSTLLLLQPVTVTDAVLIGSTIAETDHPAWAPATAYAVGARVVLLATHRIYESAIADNLGHDPSAQEGQWIDVGPTNAWAMFDQALGTVTAAGSQFSVTLQPGAVSALALLDVDADTVRVLAPGYDQTQEVIAGKAVVFSDMAVAAGANVTVIVARGGVAQPHLWNDATTWSDAGAWLDAATSTSGASAQPRPWDDTAVWSDAGVWLDATSASGGDDVSVGTLLVGSLATLGVTEASPTAGITDYSRKDVDDFGEVTVVQRAFAKRMAAKALIRTDAIDLVSARIAAVRAQPSLWIGQQGLDSLTVYGFFKDFSIEVGETVSKLSLSIEGLSQAPPRPSGAIGTVSWPDVTDPLGTKPADNADVTSENTSKDTNAVGGTPASEVLEHLTTIDEAIEDVRTALGDSESGAIGAAIAAKNAAELAAANSEAARDQSQLARYAAEAAAALAGGDAADASTAKLGAEAAVNAAGQARDQAVSAAAAAADAVGTGSASATIASTKADEASQSASIAQAQATVAVTKAAEASASATTAATSETNATASAASSSSSAGISATARDQSQAAQGAAANSATAAAGSASTAGARADAAGQSATAAQGSKVAAETARSQAESARGSAATSETNAAGSAAAAAESARLAAAAGGGDGGAGSAAAAAQSATSAAASATQAATRASAAESARTDAQTAAGQASTYRDQASTSASGAAGSASTASTQASLSAQAAGQAGIARDQAGAANGQAQQSAAAANTSASTASAKADQSSGSASAANVSAQQASGYAGTAQTSATAAQSSAAAADGHAASAATSESLAASYRDQAVAQAAAAAQSAQAVSGAAGSLAEQINSVTTTANGANTTASTALQSVNDVKTGLAGARVVLSAVSAGGVAELEVHSDSETGAGVRLKGNVEFAGKLNVGTNKTGAHTEIDETGFRVYDANGVNRIFLGLRP